MRVLRVVAFGSLALTLAAAAGGQRSPDRLIPFNEFRDAVHNAGSSDWMARPEAKVRDTAAFDEMRQYLVELYDGVHVSHSFSMWGDTIDCVPIMEQPSIRLRNEKVIETPPDTIPAPPDGADDDADAHVKPAEQWDPTVPDQYSNSTECEDGTIPMRRITLDELTRFKSILAYNDKGDADVSPVRDGAEVHPDALADSHKYAFASQSIKNYGTSDYINVWNPTVTAPQVFSLAQFWVTGGTGANLQTFEGGWQNYPDLYGKDSRLFIFYTNKNYTAGSTCYNLCKDGTFVQIYKKIVIGGAFSHYSAIGGDPQWEVRLIPYFYTNPKTGKSNWWLFYGGAGGTGAIAIGYYPAVATYNTGVMATNADDLVYGVETAGEGSWGPAGSGRQPLANDADNWTKTLFHRELYYVTKSADGTPAPPTPAKTAWVKPAIQQPDLACKYSATGPYFQANSPPSLWGEYFWAGGLGCTPP